VVFALFYKKNNYGSKNDLFFLNFEFVIVMLAIYLTNSIAFRIFNDQSQIHDMAVDVREPTCYHLVRIRQCFVQAHRLVWSHHVRVGVQLHVRLPAR